MTRENRINLQYYSVIGMLNIKTTCIGGFKRKGTHRITVPLSGVIREFRDITLFEIDGLKVYL